MEKTRNFLIPMLAIAAIATALLSCRKFNSTTSKIRNVILISIDTCRADHLGCYGYPYDTTPNIDRLAEESVLFENVISPVPLTLPAHCSMLTGTIPPYHGVHDNVDYKLDESNITIAEVLKKSGFNTGAIIGAFVLDSKFGTAQGFDSYNNKFENPLDNNDVIQRGGGETTKITLGWLSGLLEIRRNFRYDRLRHAAERDPYVCEQHYLSIGFFCL